MKKKHNPNPFGTATPTPATPPTDRTNKAIVTVVLDRSGSMGSTRAQTISGYNEYVQGLRADKQSEYSITLIQFDAPMASPELTVSYQDRALADVPDLSNETYQPRGNTPLYDAIGECVRRTDPKGRAPIVLIITDGMENASTEFTKDSIKQLIKQKESEGWTFAFLGADIDSYAVGGSFGVSAGNISNYAKGQERHMYKSLVHATSARMASARTAGVMRASAKAFLGPRNRAIPNTGLGDKQPSNFPMPSRSVTLPGGRPAAPPSFPPTAKRRNWAVNQA